MRNTLVTLRELEAADAESLLDSLKNPAVVKYMAPVPATVDHFKCFIRWAKWQRRRKAHFCFGIVPAGRPRAVGVVQIWPIEPDFSTAEWGFALAEPLWGTGIFGAAADLMLSFAFDTLGVFRLEARAVAENGRGNAALEKLGATAEGTLRGSFRTNVTVRNHVMWSILADEWRSGREHQGTGH